MTKLAFAPSRRAVLAGLGGAALAGCAAAPKALPVAAWPKVQALLDRYVAEGKVPGAAVAVKRKGAALSYLAAGKLAADSNAPFGADTIGRIYSNTKPIVGIATMILIEDGKLKLDQPIAEILPEFANPRVFTDFKTLETKPAARPITVRHLLTHTAGLGYSIIRDNPLGEIYHKAGIIPGSRGPLPPGAGSEPASLDEFGARLAAQPLAFEPGTRWSYSVAMDLLGLLIQRASGQPFDAFLQNRIFGPLGMADTGFVVPPAGVARLSTMVTPTKEKGVIPADDRAASMFAKPGAYPSGGGGLVSTAVDQAKFAAMMLGEGRLGRARILKPETMAIARSDIMPEGAERFMKTSGFGAAMRVVRAESAATAGEPAGSFGWGGAAGTTLWVDPANEAYCFMMVQFVPSSAYPVWQDIRAAFYEDVGV